MCVFVFMFVFVCVCVCVWSNFCVYMIWADQQPIVTTTVQMGALSIWHIDGTLDLVCCFCYMAQWHTGTSGHWHILCIGYSAQWGALVHRKLLFAHCSLPITVCSLVITMFTGDWGGLNWQWNCQILLCCFNIYPKSNDSLGFHLKIKCLQVHTKFLLKR